MLIALVVWTETRNGVGGHLTWHLTYSEHSTHASVFHVVKVHALTPLGQFFFIHSCSMAFGRGMGGVFCVPGKVLSIEGTEGK